MTENENAPAEEQTAADEQAVLDAASDETSTDAEQVSVTSSEELTRLLEAAQAKADENWDLVMRTRAEMDNLKKRTQRDIEKAHKYGQDSLLGELLPVRDSMELGINAALEDGTDLAKVREGMELTLKMLASALEKAGVEEVDPIGQKFDPERHQAMSMVQAEGVESGQVITVVQKGYLLNGRLIRPAMVIVAK